MKARIATRVSEAADRLHDEGKTQVYLERDTVGEVNEEREH
jgi:hypothetical protein